MKNAFLVFCLFVGARYTQPTFACINENEEMSGVLILSSGEIFRLIPKSVEPEVLRSFLKEFDSCKTNLTLECSDLVAAYLYLQQADSAAFWSKRLVQKFPNEYNVLINYAVALELQGKLNEALVYMKKALAINPYSHFGSEWIHQRILENYIAGNTAPTRSILGLDFGNDSLPKRPDSLTSITPLLTELHYQLEDRLFFMQQSDKKDVLFGSLLYDYANLLFLAGYVDFAPDYFAMAEQYGFMHPAQTKRVVLLNTILMERDVQQRLNNDRLERKGKNLRFFGITALGFVLVIIVAFVVRHKTRKLR